MEWLVALGTVFSCLIIVMIPILIIFNSRVVYTLICLLVIFCLSIFIIYDTKLISSGHKYGLTYDDYIIGALLLYTVQIYFIKASIGCDHTFSLHSNVAWVLQKG